LKRWTLKEKIKDFLKTIGLTFFGAILFSFGIILITILMLIGVVALVRLIIFIFSFFS